MDERKPPKEQEELLRKMRAEAQLMEDELMGLSLAEYESSGKLSDVKLCEKSTQYENYLLTISQLEKLLEEKGK